MNDVVLLGPWLRRFLTEHIVSERNLAINTRKSYRDTFALLLPFVSTGLRKPVDRLAVSELTSARVLQFLAHLEESRGCSVQTRNQRLTAIRSFAGFVGSREPAFVEWCGNLRAIPLKKAVTKPIGWLTKSEIHARLAVPDRTTQRGRNEHGLLLFLYNTGARVSEATQLRMADLQRRFNTAVVLVHHARKSAATRPGQALRGSSELHAWGDSNLYLRRRKGQIVMSVEHRAAASLNDIELELADDGQGAALRLRHDTAPDDAPKTESPQQRIVQVLADAEQPLSQRQIRERAATRHTTVATILGTLVREGRVEHDAAGGYRIAANTAKKCPAPSDDANATRHPDALRFPAPGSPIP